MKFHALFLSLIFLSSIVYSQEETDQTLSLSDQYINLKTNAQTFNEYKVIRESRLDDWFNVIEDTLASRNNTINELSVALRSQQDTIDNLQQRIDGIQNQLNLGEFEKTHINIFGLNFSKGSYKAISLSGITSLFIIIVFLSMKIIDSGKTKRDAIRVHDALSTEFEEYKRRALEKQTKLARDLQTERNKIEELKKKR